MNRQEAAELIPGEWYVDRKKGSPGAVVFLKFQGKALDGKKCYTLSFDAQIVGHDLSGETGYFISSTGLCYEFVKGWKTFYKPTPEDLKYVELRTYT